MQSIDQTEREAQDVAQARLTLALAIDRATRMGVGLVMRHTPDKSAFKIELGPYGEGLFYPRNYGAAAAYRQAAYWIGACLDSHRARTA